MLSGKSVGPYTGVSLDVTRAFRGKGKYRFVLYGAYNAYGLIGSEKNGIAVLDEQQKAVLCDELEKADSGYFGPSSEQLQAFEQLQRMPWKEFQALINGHSRARYAI